MENISKNLFDIKPMDDWGRVNFKKINSIIPVVNLKKEKKDSNKIADSFFFGTWDNSAGVKNLAFLDKKQLINNKHLELPRSKKDFHLELEKYINSGLNIKKEIKDIGGRTVVKRKMGKPRHRIIEKQDFTLKNQDSIEFKDGSLENPSEYQVILSRINQRPIFSSQTELEDRPKRVYPFEYLPVNKSHDAGSITEVEKWIRSEGLTDCNVGRDPKLKIDISHLAKFLSYPAVRRLFKINNFMVPGVACFGIIVIASFGRYGINLKNDIIKESNSAVIQLEQANKNLQVLDFKAASNNFAEAYGEFSKAGNNINFLGAGLTSLFAELPGAGKIKSAKNLVEAGRLLAEAGKSMSEAVNSLSKTGTMLDFKNASSNSGNEILKLKNSLSISSKNLSKAAILLSEVDVDSIPQDKQESFNEFISKLPDLKKLVSDAEGYANFLENLTGSSETKKYLVLFQNDSELRPTGGFPGTYAIVVFKNGKLSDFKVDDIYNLDGQLKENIIPPQPLQHITPNWGMRDANWFIDFSVSAQKTMEFFKKESGYDVDGVITITPKIMSGILKAIGPVDVPDYGFTINEGNFLSLIQREVEYGENRQQPKQVVVDIAPKILEKINSSGSDKWLDIFNVFISGLDKKDISMYFKDLNLESFVADKGFGGLIKKTLDDYLMVNLSNIKGSKTDEVTDNSISTDIYLENGQIIHELEITRRHQGGSSRYGFYNKQNPAYVRVLVPEGSELVSISGNSRPDFQPLINYSGTDFKHDGDLFRLESSYYFNESNGVSTYRESGKTGFAFWLITDPGKQKTVKIKYSVPIPDINGIYIQKQSGLDVSNFNFSVGGNPIYTGNLDKDLELRFRLE